MKPKELRLKSMMWASIPLHASKQASKKKTLIKIRDSTVDTEGRGGKKVGKKILLETYRSMQFNVMLSKKTNLN
jgi:hypothetical protein